MTRSTAEIADAIGQLQAIQNLAHRRQLRLIAEYDAAQAWREDGATSMAAWLSYSLNVTHATGAEEARVAGALEDLPAVGDAYANGELPRDQLRALTRFATSETDASLAVEAPKLSAAQTYRMAARHRPVTTEDEDGAHRTRCFGLRETPHFTRLSGRLPHAEAAVVAKALERVAGPPEADPVSGLYPPYEQRLADALVELSSTRLAAESDADRATVAVHVDAAILAGGDGIAELEHGEAVSAETARRLVCNARWYVVVDGPDGTPIGIGRTTRQVPPWLLRELKRRDLGCVFPGCGRRRWVDAHHIVPWSQGGPTDLDNLALLCGFHHRLVHEGGWEIARDRDRRLIFVGPDGRVRRLGSPRLRDDLRRRLSGDDAPAPQLLDTG
jgi:hypothetical protein